MKLYYHKTDGGAEYLTDTFIKCNNGHKEGHCNDKTKFLIRIDGDITKDAEIDIRDESKQEAIKQLTGLLEWSDRLGSDEVAEISCIITNLRK